MQPTVTETAITLEGEVPLEARFSQPVPPRACTWFVLAHPHPQYGGSMDNKVVEILTRGIADLGAPTLRFNFRGVGASGGHHDEGRGEQADLRAAIRYAEDEGGATHVVTVGYSFGSLMGSLVVPELRDPNRHPLIAVAPPVGLHSFDHLVGFEGDVHMVVGTRDEFCTVDQMNTLARRVGPRAATHVVEGAGHFFTGGLPRLWQALAPALQRYAEM